MNKWLKVVIVLVLLTIVVLILYGFGIGQKEQLAPTVQIHQKAESYSMNGKITAISGHTYTLLLVNGKSSKLFRVTDKVDVVKRSVVKGNLVLNPATLDQLKIGSEVAIYNSTDPTSQQELVDITRVEILK